jgi:conjugal transfer mating pair stabilization protein TraG
MLEIFTVGGGEYLVNTFNAVAAWSGGGGFRSMLQVVFVMGLAYSLFVVAFSMDWRAWLNWFIQATAIYMMLLVPTVTVKVTDRIDPSLAPSVVDNVPLGLGVMASFTSQLGDWMTETAETVFVMPAALKMNAGGMIYGARLLEKAQNSFQITDPVFRANMDEHFKQCVFYDVLLGFTPMEKLTNSSNLWSDIGPGSTARAQKWLEKTAGGTVDSYIIPCNDAYGRMSAQWNALLDIDATKLAKVTYPKMVDSAALARLKADIPQVAAAMHGTSGDAYQYLQQVSTIDAFLAARESFSDAGWDAYASQRADAQARNTYTSIAQQAMTWVPLLGIVLQVVFYAMFPVIFPLFLFPRTGISTLKGYATGFFYLASWGPLYVILHMFVMNRAASSYAAISPTGPTLLVVDGITAVNNDIATVAGFLMMSVPFLAAGMARGAMAIAGHATSMLAPAQSAAEAAASERTTGNYSYGNMSYQNLTSNMRQANKWDERPYITGGFASSSFTNADGGVEHGFANGDYAYDTRQGISNLAFTPTRTSGFDAAVSRTLSEGQSLVDSRRQSASESWQATVQTGTDLLRTAEQRASSGTETGSGFNNSLSRMHDVSRGISSGLQSRFGLTEAEADRIARTSQMIGEGNVGLSGGVGKGSSLPGLSAQATAGLAARLVTSAQNETGRTITADQALSEIQDYLFRETNTSQARTARDDFQRETSSSSDSRVRSLSERLSAGVTESRGLTREAAISEETFKRVSDDLRESSSNGYSLNQNDTQEFVTYAQERLRADPLLSSQGWTPGMVMPRTEGQRQVRDILLNDFVNRQINDAREKMGLRIPDRLDTGLTGPSITSAEGVRGWGGRQQAAVRGQGPDVDVRASSRDQGLADDVQDQILGGSARVMREGFDLDGRVSDARGRGADLGAHVDHRNHQSLIETMPVVSPLIEGARERIGEASDWVQNQLGMGGGNVGAGPVQTVLPRSGAGFRSYSPQSQQYGTASLVSELAQSSAAWSARGGSPVNIGDISRRGGGDLPGHDTHEVGRQVDVRPFRHDGSNQPTNWQSRSYDREQTRNYIEFMKERNPGMTVLFNDPVLVREGLTKPYRGHDNHLHLNFGNRG